MFAGCYLQLNENSNEDSCINIRVTETQIERRKNKRQPIRMETFHSVGTLFFPLQKANSSKLLCIKAFAIFVEHIEQSLSELRRKKKCAAWALQEQ